MKPFFVTLLLTISLLALILVLDLIMGTRVNHLLTNLQSPFMVSEPAEYFLSGLLLAFLIIKPIIGFLYKKMANTHKKKES